MANFDVRSPQVENINKKFGDIYPDNDKPIYGHRVSDILSFLPVNVKNDFNNNERQNTILDETSDPNKIDPKNFKTAREYELALSNLYEKQIEAQIQIENSNANSSQQKEALDQINKSLRLEQLSNNATNQTTLTGENIGLFLNGAQRNFQYMLKLRAAIDGLIKTYGTRLSFGKNFVNSSGRAGNVPDYNDPKIDKSLEACAIILYQLISIGAIKASDELNIQGFNINTGEIELDPSLIEYNRKAKQLKLPLKGVFLINDRITNVDNRYATFTGIDLKATYAIGYKVGNLKGMSQITWSIHRGKPDAPVGDEIPAVNRARGRRCIPETERVFIKEKGYIPINEVKCGDLVQSTPNSFNKVLGVYNQGSKICYNLKLKNGYNIIASHDHPISTQNGWIETSKLKKNDKVHISNYLPFSNNKVDIENDILILLGYLIGDGTIRFYKKKNSNSIKYRISLAIADKEMNTIGNEVEEILKRNNIHFRDTRDKDSKCISRVISVCSGSGSTDWRLRKYNKLHEALLKYNMYGSKAINKFIPNDLVANMSEKQTKLFLSKLLATDGCVSITGKDNKYIEIKYCSVSELLIDQIRLLLSKFSIGCLKYKRNKVGKTGGRENIISNYNSYELVISNSLYLVRFIRKLSVFGKDKKLKDLESLLINRIQQHVNIDYVDFTNKVRNILKDRKDINVTKFLNNNNLYKRENKKKGNNKITVKHFLKIAKLLNDKTFSDYVIKEVENLINKNDEEFEIIEVLSVNKVGNLEVWDLEVEERHSFICEFILVHNTIAGTMVFNIFDEHPITAIYPYSFFPQDEEQGKNNKRPVRESFIKPDQIPAFDITLILTNEYGYASIMTLFGVEIMDDGGGIGMNDLINEEVIQYTAKDVDLLHSVKVDKNGMIDPYDLTGFNESDIWNRRTQIYQQAEGSTFQERYDEYLNR